MRLEVGHGNEKAIQPGGQIRGVSVAQAAPDLDVHENVLRKSVLNRPGFCGGCLV